MMHYIGKQLQERMYLLGNTVQELAEMAYISEETLQDLLCDRVPCEAIGEYQLSLVCSALHCSPEYFWDEGTRDGDLLVSTKSRNDSVKSMNEKARLQDYVNDYAFLEEVLSEEEK